jgi:hypothetical protein
MKYCSACYMPRRVVTGTDPLPVVTWRLGRYGFRIPQHARCQRPPSSRRCPRHVGPRRAAMLVRLRTWRLPVSCLFSKMIVHALSRRVRAA